MADQRAAAERFLALHVRGEPLLMPNAWDVGSARMLASLGIDAIATTSGGFAASLGRLDYNVTREEAIAHGAALAAAVQVPVSADLEDCYAQDSGGVAETVRRARDAGLAGGSIEDWSSSDGGTLLEPELAAERVAEAAAAAAQDGGAFVLTARAENYLRGNPDLDDTIARLTAYERAGADVLYAPGLPDLDALREIVAAVTKPVNVLITPALASVGELAVAGAARISLGGSLAFSAYGAALTAVRELQQGSGRYLAQSRQGMREVREALGD
ncbi:MAG TPA: isocitrate lyase/phosphoenolpyruvate mutase family protein [Solirubrobacteraceae bacterium]